MINELIDSTLPLVTSRLFIAISKLVQGFASSLISSDETTDERLSKMVEGISNYSIEMVIVTIF